MRLHLPLPPLLACALVACAASDGADDLGGQLGEPLRASVVAAGSTTAVHGTIRRPDGLHAGDANLTVRTGDLVVRIDRDPDGEDRLVIDELRIAFQDVVLPAAYFHDGQVLTGIVGRLEEPLFMRAVSTSDGAVWGSGTTDVRLDWTLRVADQAVTLASQTLTDFEVELVISDDDGALRADLMVIRPGVMWSWADILTLGDLELQATARPRID